MAVSAAALDPRIKATVASTMYDMTKVTREGYFGADAKRQSGRRNEGRFRVAAQGNRP